MFDKLLPGMRRSWDLSIIALLSLLLALLIYALPENPLRIVLGLMTILLLPGYLLMSALFPDKNVLGNLERIVISVGLSLAIVSLIGFLWNYTPYGIRLDAVLWSIILFDLVFFLVGNWRRNSSPTPFLPGNPKAYFSFAKRLSLGNTKFNRMFTVILIIAVLTSFAGLLYVLAEPRTDESFSEFYILGPDGTESGYPYNLTVNETAKVILGIANHEYRVVKYTIEVWLVNATYGGNETQVHQLFYIDELSTVLDHVPANNKTNWTPEWEEPYNFSVAHPGTYKLWFLLQLDGVPFSGVQNQDYSGTPAQDRFLTMISSKQYYSLNINLSITL